MPTTTQPANDRHRIRALDGLRGLAALVVVLYHYTTRYPELYGPREGLWFHVPWGHYGVRLFFIISGFVIFMTIDRTENLWQFIASRFARLYPVFWVCMGITLAVIRWTDLPKRQISNADAWWNLTMVPGMHHAQSIDGVYWSLRYELSFYVVMGLLLGLGLRRFALLFIAAIVVASAFAQQQTINVHFYAKGADLNIWDFNPYWFSMFLIGMTLYDMREKFRWWHGALLALSFGEIAIQQFYWKTQDAADPGWPYMGVIALSTTLVFAASRWRVPLLTSRPIVFLGVISYSWYLIHQNVGFAIIRWAESRGWHIMPAVTLAFAASIAIASALNKLIEQPANTWLRRLLIRTPTPRASAALGASNPAIREPMSPTSQAVEAIKPT